MGDIARGRNVQDKNNVGGLHKIYFLKLDETVNGYANTIAYDTTNTDQIDSLLNGGAVTGETATIYRYNLQGNSDYSETENNSRENGTVFYEQVLNVNLKLFSAEDAFDTYQLATSRWHIIMEYKNGTRRLMGLDYGAEKSGTNTVGGAMGDGSNFSHTFTSMEKKPANFLTADAFDLTGNGTGITITGAS